MRVTRTELRHTIRHVLLEQAEDEILPTSEFSPAGRPLTLYIVDPSDENYEKVRPMFSVDALGHGFYVHGRDLREGLREIRELAGGMEQAPRQPETLAAGEADNGSSSLF